jgi:hypothetical protein
LLLALFWLLLVAKKNEFYFTPFKVKLLKVTFLSQLLLVVASVGACSQKQQARRISHDVTHVVMK